jgi:hypothetical protein
MEKEFVTHEQALALKELGFDEKCFGCYQLSELRDYKKGLEISWIMTLNTLNGYRIYDDETQTTAPLKQQVFRWFREKYNAHMHPSRLMQNIYVVRYGDWDSEAFKTYEGAENACIDKLIEIAKQQDND